jgi:hypothetical protein
VHARELDEQARGAPARVALEVAELRHDRGQELDRRRLEPRPGPRGLERVARIVAAQRRAQRDEHRLVLAPDPLQRARRRAHDARVAVAERAHERIDEQHRRRIVARPRRTRRAAPRPPRCAARRRADASHARTSARRAARRRAPHAALALELQQVRAHRAARGQCSATG